MPPMAPSPYSSMEQYTMDSDTYFHPDPGERVIMLIDDSLAVRRIIEASFARIGIMTTTFPDGLSGDSSTCKARSRRS